MKYDIYPVKASNSSLQFEFISEGPKGQITKFVEYRLYDAYSNVYNLSLGDLTDGQIDDTMITNNGDSIKVLLTVASTLTNFFKTRETATVFLFGSTVARNRLYRMMISNNIHLFEDRFVVFGLVGEDWYIHEKDFTYDGFMIQTKTL